MKKVEPKKEKPKAKKAKKPKKAKKGVRVEHSRGKRKRAIARATVKEGSGRIRVNSKLVSSCGNKYFRSIVAEPFELIGPDGLKVDVSVKVRGGGEMGQAQACRTAIAKALAQYFGEGVIAKYNEDDRYLLREDPRRVEPKKYMGPKARARNQKSYR
ncbi:MAG: 30S ribosomal protein S9 [bacterium]|nr:30S ribosomal protein S9 [bacterium]